MSVSVGFFCNFSDVNTMDISDIGILAAERIFPCLETSSFLCGATISCGNEIKNSRKAFVQHLKRKGHELELDKVRVLWKAAERCTKHFPDTHPLRRSYNEGGFTNGKLPRLKALPILRAKKCGKCDKLFEAMSTLQRHSKKEHGSIMSRSFFREGEWHDCQSLSMKKGEKTLFLVLPEDTAEIDITENEDSVCMNSILNRRICEYDAGSQSSTAINILARTSDREKSGFVSLAKCPERLEQYGMEIQDGWNALKWPEDRPNFGIRTESGEIGVINFERQSLSVFMNRVTHAIDSLMKDARHLFREADGFRSTLLDISTSGTLEKGKIFRFLMDDETGDRSSERYSRSCRLLVLAALRAKSLKTRFPLIPFSSELSKAAQSLAKCEEEEDDEKLKKEVHNVLCIIFFEESNVYRGSCQLFASWVAACSMVKQDGENRFRFKQGKQLSPFISAILYSASCVAFLEMKKYGNNLESGESEIKIRKLMEKGSKTGLSVFIDLRSICATVRIEECKLNLFHICKQHNNCGIIGGQEMSAKEVGDAVRSMQKSFSKVVMQELLKGKPLPDNFRESCDKIKDDDSNDAPGYWAFADLRNRDFVKHCCIYAAKECVQSKGQAELEQWFEKAEELVPLLLAIIHLSAGAPGRGTETCSLGIRNTSNCRRGIFFVGSEVMMIPTFNKTRGVKRGRMVFVARYLDTETSYLMKLFFLIIHPALVCYAEMKKCSSQVGMGTKFSDKKCSRLRDSLGLGVTEPEKMAQKVGIVFSKFRIPFNFSGYRHWQRGFAKTRSGNSHLRRLYYEENEDSNECEERGVEPDNVFEASIVQAGHSLRTAKFVYAQTAGYRESDQYANEDIIGLFRNASLEWHVCLGLEDNQTKKFESKQEIAKSSLSVAPVRAKLGEKTAFLSPNAIDNTGRKNFVEEIAKRVSQELRGQAKRVEIMEPGAESLFLGVSDTNMENSDTATPCELRKIPVETAKKPPRPVVPEFEALEALRKVTKHLNAGFRSEHQKKAMVSVYSKRSDIAVILPTGCGKTAVVMGPILYESGVTLWISPLRALLQETEGRLKKAGVSLLDLDNGHEYENKGLGNVLLVSPEQIGKGDLSLLLKRWNEEESLNRIVFDEAHIPVFAQNYRECMLGIRSLESAKLSCPRVLLTATAPSKMLKSICSAIGVEYEGLEVIRGDPCRPNLIFNVLKLDDFSIKTLKKRVVNEAKLSAARCRRRSFEKLYPKGGKCLVVCLTIAHVEILRNAIDAAWIENCTVLRYHSKMKEEELQKSTLLWDRAKPDDFTVMVATDGFCTGTDKPDVRSVIIAGACRSVVELYQACGRGGRDGFVAHCNILYYRGYLVKANGGKEDVYKEIEGAGSFENWAESTMECRRRKIEKHMEGLEKYPTCIEREGTVEKCDFCRLLEKSITPVNGVQVRVTGNKRPTDCDLHASKIRRKTYQERKERQEDRIRRWGVQLAKYCISCLVEVCTSMMYAGSPKLVSGAHRRRVERCSPLQCRGMRNTCLRCMGYGHRASVCNTIESVQVSRRMSCRRCFLQNVGGWNIHRPSEYGVEKACPFEAVTKLLMRCYQNENAREKVLQMICIEKRRELSDIGAYRSWLLEDKLGQSAALFDAMDHIHFIMHLKYWGLN